MADAFRVGLIGANAKNGWAARAHLPAFKAGIPGLELAAVCTTKQESAEESARMFGAPLAYWDHHRLLENPDIDVVGVSVKLPGHYQLTMDALNAGKHVYTEWPLGTNTAQAKEMATLAKQKGVCTVVGLQSRRSAAYRRMRELIDSGHVGDVLSVTMTQFSGGGAARASARTWMYDKAAGANVLTITFGHAVDGLMVLAGGIDSLSSLVTTQIKQWLETDTGRIVENVTAPDHVLVSGRLKNGAALSMHVAQVAGLATGHRTEVHGSKGTLVLTCDSSPHNAEPMLLEAQGDAKELRAVSVEQEPWVREVGLKGSAVNIGKLWKSFSDAIRSGADGFDPDFEAAVRHHELMDTVKHASDTGQRQSV